MATPESLTSSASHVTKQERDELCIALTAAQESAIIQLLLEICLPTEQDKKVVDADGYQNRMEVKINTTHHNNKSSIHTSFREFSLSGVQEEALFGPQVTVLQEIRCLVCSYFHHTFICDPPLVKLVHFQVMVLFRCTIYRIAGRFSQEKNQSCHLFSLANLSLNFFVL
jgi:hypothetical protein